MSDGADEILGEQASDELWLISYADLITLLIGFFVLLVAASPVKLSRFERIAASISGSNTAPLVDLREKVDELIERSSLSDQVQTKEDAEGLSIEFKDALLFDSGSAEIRPEGREVVTRVAAMLAELPERPVVVEGHTDEVPIHTAQYRSNWELSAARAIHVLEALEANGVGRQRLSARGFADTKRKNDGTTLDQQRAASRRVLIRVE